MATVEEHPAATNGTAAAAGDIAVENPATGEVIAHVPDMTAEQVAELARAARAAQPAWEALGFEGRGRILRRAQKWVVDHSERLIQTIVSETGKAYEDALIAEVMYGANAFGFWSKNAPGFLADERVKTAAPLLKGKKLVLRYRPLGLVGVIGPWNYPLTNSFGDCIPALAAGNAVILKPSEVTPLTSLLLAEALRECGMPEDVFAVATGRGDTGAARDRPGRHDQLHRLDGHRPQDHGEGGRDAHARVAGARRQGPDDRPGRRRPRARGQPRRLLLDVQRRADVRQHRARLCRGAGLRRLRGQGHREGAGDCATTARPAPGTADVGAITFPPQVEIVERHVAGRPRQGRARARRRRARP